MKNVINTIRGKVLEAKTFLIGNPAGAKIIASSVVTAGIMVANTVTAFAAEEGSTTTGVNIASAMTNAVNLLFAFLLVYGGVYIALGIKAVAGAMSDEGGQDQQALAKGKGQIIRGVICAGAGSVVKFVLGHTMDDLITSSEIGKAGGQ